MTKYFSMIFVLSSFLISFQSIAAFRVDLTLNQNLSSSENKPQQRKQSSSFTIREFSVPEHYSRNLTYKGTSFSKIDGSLPPYGTMPNNWVYQKVDDYFSVAVRLRQVCGYIYAPFNRSSWRSDTCQNSATNNVWSATTWDSSIRIDRTLINGTYANNIFLGRWGGCLGFYCSTQDVTYANVYLRYAFTVPQNCEVNAGQLIDIDFGKIPTSSFTTAGQKAKGVNPITRNIGIKCNNGVSTNAPLRMRIQSNKVSNDAIVSDNPDVGFLVTDAKDRTLVPNNINKYVRFVLNQGKADVPIKVYPVGLTGRSPKEGTVTSQAYIRIDFD